DQAIREVGAARLEQAQGLPDRFGFLDHKLPRAQDALQDGDDLGLGAAVALLQHPDQFGEGNGRHKPRPRLVAFIFYQLDSLGGLPRIVLRDVAQEGVGIESDHQRAPRRLIAAFIALIEIGLGGRLTMPLSERTSSVAAFNANSPGPTSMNSTRSPVARPSFSRTATGIVIWPLLVNVAAVILVPYFSSNSLL